MPTHVLINGRYELKDILGQGGMGVVYRAFDNATKRDVALKTMHDTANALAVELFSKEWKVLAGLSHPNIVDILDYGEFEVREQRRPYFVMPLLPGKTLDLLIHHSSQRLTITRTVEILRQACRGLQVAHDRGLVHRDLKPSNIFVMEDDAAKIIDFGVVRLSGTRSVTGLKGTVQYMSPEQLDLKPATPQSDIFSLGVVAYEAFTGRRPFARKSDLETAEAVRLHIPPAASEINPATGDQISRVIHKAIAKAPWNRFANARELGDTLEKALRGELPFDSAKNRPRIERASKAFNEGDLQFASDILNELEAEGNIEPEISVLRLQIEQAGRQRTVRQLLESARTRLEQGEYPLAFQKVQEVLRLDSDNAEALGMRNEIESQRSERQIENWLKLAREHLDRGAFSEARQGLEEALKLNSNDSRLHQLLADLSRQEKENSKARLEKEQLYESAKLAFQNGEISTALSRLERILELNRRVPDRTTPERDALYQTFYNQVRSENDANRIAYEDARRRLVEKGFGKARIICEENLAKYPGQALFQALKLEIDERERQELYAYIAETERRLDAEPDLDRKLSIAREAVDRYPQEPQFKQSLKLVRDRRDLAIGIVAKGRQYEERGQFTEAISQWEILHGIYPQYPDLAFELEQLKRRRDQQSRNETKSRLVEQTDAALTSGDFGRACELAAQALNEFPDDPELVGLERLAAEGIERRQKSQHLLAVGQELCDSGKFEEGVAALRSAAELDPQDLLVRSTLMSALIGRAQEFMDSDWAAAEPLINSALELDSTNAAARSLRSQLQDHRRRMAVDACLAEARELRTRNDSEAALAKVEACLKTYPNDQRLLQFKTGLRKDSADVEARKQRRDDLNELQHLSTKVEHTNDRGLLDSILSRSVLLSNKYPEDAAFSSLTGVIGQTVSAIRTATGEPHHLRESRNSKSINMAARLSQWQALSWTSLLKLTRETTDRWRRSSARRALSASLEIWAGALGARTRRAPARWRRKNFRFAWLSLIAIALVLLPFIWRLGTPHRTPTTPLRSGPFTKATYPVNWTTSPAGATIHVDGKPVSGSPLMLAEGSHTIEAALVGYRTLSKNIHVDAKTQPLAFTLEPELQHVRIMTTFPAGRVLLDGKDAGALQMGQFVKDDLSPGEHTVRVVESGRELVNVHLLAAPGRMPQLLSPLTDHLVLLSSIGDTARVYAPGLELTNDNGTKSQVIPTEGLDISSSSTEAPVVNDGKNRQTLAVAPTNFPLLTIYSNVATDAQPVLSITSNVDAPQIAVNGKPVHWRASKGRMTGRLAPGNYQVKLSKPGYEDVEKAVNLVTGDKKAVAFTMKTLPVASLLVQGGTPGAAVLVDDDLKGVTDATGRLAVTPIKPGTHEVTIRKDNFESSEYSTSVPDGKSVTIPDTESQLTPYGALEFRVLTPGSEITFKRDNETHFRSATNNATLPLRQGSYMVKVTASGFTPKEGYLRVAPGKVTIVNWTLSKPSLARSEEHLQVFEEPAMWRKDNGWFVYTGSSYGWLQPANGAFWVDVRKKSGGILGFGGGIDFVIGYAQDGKDKVAFHINKDGWLTRKTTVGGKTQQANATSRIPGDEFFRMQIKIEPNRVSVRDQNGKIIDDCQVTGFNLTSGKWGFKNGIGLSITR